MRGQTGGCENWGHWGDGMTRETRRQEGADVSKEESISGTILCLRRDGWERNFCIEFVEAQTIENYQLSAFSPCYALCKKGSRLYWVE